MATLELTSTIEPFRLSQQEAFLVDAFYRTESYKETSQMLGIKFPRKKFSPKGVKIWIERKPHVQRELMDRFQKKKEWGWYKEEDLGTDLIKVWEGRKKVTGEQVQIAKLIMMSKGWLKGTDQVQQNTIINFTQRDGTD